MSSLIDPALEANFDRAVISLSEMIGPPNHAPRSGLAGWVRAPSNHLSGGLALRVENGVLALWAAADMPDPEILPETAVWPLTGSSAVNPADALQEAQQWLTSHGGAMVPLTPGQPS